MLSAMCTDRSMDFKIWPGIFASLNRKRMMLDDWIGLGFVHDTVVKFPVKGQNLVITINELTRVRCLHRLRYKLP
jgi:hypothetical protein